MNAVAVGPSYPEGPTLYFKLQKRNMKNHVSPSGGRKGEKKNFFRPVVFFRLSPR